MNASKKTRKRLSATGIFLIFMAISLAVFILDILPNLMRDFHLMSSGIVTRGTVVSIGSCGGGGDSGSTNPTYDVQFVDNKGQAQVENVSGCTNVIGDLSVGDSISILYAPDDPTVIAAQDSFTYEVQLDEVFFAVFAGVIPIGCALAILLIQLRRYLMVHQKLGPTQGNWLISRIKK